jgi:colanic acid/amylovoran biosynthesis glycosyltransferase
LRRLAYLFPAFPVLHQTFTLGEVLGLKRRGYDLRLISLKGSSEDLQQESARPLIRETLYAPKLASKPMAVSFMRALTRRPLDTLRLFGHVFSAWRQRDAERREVEESAAPSTLGFGERILAVYHSNPVVYLAKSLMLVPYAIWLAERLEEEGIEHVHSHWATYPTTVAYLVRKWAGIPYSFTAHAYDIYMNSRMLPAKLEDATFVVTCADTNRRYLASLCGPEAGERVHLNYHGTDLGRFTPVDHSRGEAYRIMSCGWLKEYKGFHILVEALSMLVARGIDASVDIAGDGPQRAYLERLAAELGVADRLRLHGYLEHGELSRLYASADTFALPSIVMGRYGRQDVIPNVLAEAMATGVPVVGTDVGGVTELVEDGVDGRVVPERDPQALADALEDLWRNPQRAQEFGRSGRRKVESIWDRENNLDELCGIINKNVADRVEAGNSSLASGASNKAGQMMEAEGRAASPITVS